MTSEQPNAAEIRVLRAGQDGRSFVLNLQPPQFEQIAYNYRDPRDDNQTHEDIVSRRAHFATIQRCIERGWMTETVENNGPFDQWIARITEQGRIIAHNSKKEEPHDPTP